VRQPAPRGRSSARIARDREPWPPADRDPADIAVVAARILTVGGRLRSQIRGVARERGVPPDLVALLLLFAEKRGWLRIIDIADLLGIDKATASRLATRAETAGLIDKLTSSIDHREVACRLSVGGRNAVSAGLDSVRPHAKTVLRPPNAQRNADACALLEPSTRFTADTRNWGWRAVIRARDDDDY
jgi:DNA-binding MarR family transcriptional regulator